MKMSMNYAFGFSLFLLILVGLNIYFFYALNTVERNSSFHMPSYKLDITPTVFREIYEYLNYLPSQYKVKNVKFTPVQKSLIQSFNSTGLTNTQNVWQDAENVSVPIYLYVTPKWADEESLFPHKNGASGLLLQAIRTSQIALVDNAPKGTQLKLLLLLEGKQKLYFKPKRYNLTDVIKGNIYAGFDRHNSEVFAYYLAMVLNFRWIPPSSLRKIHVQNIIPLATSGLKRTMVKNESGSYCIYGKCFYCKINETVCPNNKGEIEGAAILYLDKQLRAHRSPWRRSYNKKKMEWEKDDNFCKKVAKSLSKKRILNLIDVSIFDFLIQNGDRHRYEVYKDKIIILDNGKGLGNPLVDELDILAPLYQCCMLTLSTWQHLEIVSGGSLTETIKVLSNLHGEKLATEEHFKAVERRLLKIYATVQYCIGKHGSAKLITMIKPIKDTFLYFAYGSNLFKKRIHINNPSAEFLGIGRLEAHQLDFIHYSENWRGASATIIPTEKAHVWGAIWRLHDNDMPALDKQEGVDTNWYFPKTVDVVTPEGFGVKCRTYQQTINPPLREDGEELPFDRRPCITYLECIVKGAIECEIPEYYIKELKKIPHNGQEAPPKMIELLNLK